MVEVNPLLDVGCFFQLDEAVLDGFAEAVFQYLGVAFLCVTFDCLGGWGGFHESRVLLYDYLLFHSSPRPLVHFW